MKIEFGEGVYPGEYLIDVAKDLKSLVNDTLLNIAEDEWMAQVRDFSTEAMLALAYFVQSPSHTVAIGHKPCWFLNGRPLMGLLAVLTLMCNNLLNALHRHYLLYLCRSPA